MTDVPIPYLQAPSVLINQSLDALGTPKKIIGDISDGSEVAEAARRNYGQALRNLLRTAHWDFARRRVALTLLGDATGSPPIGVSPQVECPWAYAYAWPIDGVMGRWLPWMPTGGQPVSSTGVPLTTGNSANVQYGFQPGRFLVSSSDLYPIEIGNVPWTQQPDLQRTFGVGPVNRKVILTDCCQAEFVYTRFVPVIEEWDSLFRQALVMMMALILAPVAIDDPKLRMAEVARLVPMLKNAVDDARVANGNEAGMPASVDFEASFIRARSQGYWGNGWGGPLGGGGAGYFSCGWESMSWGGSVY